MAARKRHRTSVDADAFIERFDADDGDHNRRDPIILPADESLRRRPWRSRWAISHAAASPATSHGRRWHVTVMWMFRVVDTAFVAAVAYLCWTLVWCGGPFERMGWPMFAMFGGMVLVPIGWVYFLICSARRPIMAPLLTIAAVVGLSALSIATGVVQKVRWAQARPAVLAIAEHPPARGQTQHLRLGTYSASVSGLLDGTVLVAFHPSWDGLLYVPEGIPEPDRHRSGIGPEMMPRWWYYDTD